MKHKTCDKAFKEHAVNLWLGSGQSAQEVADEFGIKWDRLYTWKQQLDFAGASNRRAGSPNPPGMTSLRSAIRSCICSDWRTLKASQSTSAAGKAAPVALAKPTHPATAGHIQQCSAATGFPLVLLLFRSEWMKSS